MTTPNARPPRTTQLVHFARVRDRLFMLAASYSPMVAPPEADPGSFHARQRWSARKDLNHQPLAQRGTDSHVLLMLDRQHGRHGDIPPRPDPPSNARRPAPLRPDPRHRRGRPGRDHRVRLARCRDIRRGPRTRSLPTPSRTPWAPRRPVRHQPVHDERELDAPARRAPRQRFVAWRRQLERSTARVPSRARAHVATGSS